MSKWALSQEYISLTSEKSINVIYRISELKEKNHNNDLNQCRKII